MSVSQARLHQLTKAASTVRNWEIKEIAARLLEYLQWAAPMGQIEVGTAVVKSTGYPFPGEVRSAFLTASGELRYVVEATGDDCHGMMAIFTPNEIEPIRERRAA